MQIVTASRNKQITMLHEKCVALIYKGILCTPDQKRHYLDQAQNILAQLQSALRIEDSVSQGLFYLYDYAYVLCESGITHDCHKALAIIRILRDTFRELLRR
jgi:flagellin-specific chaperone FliS